MKDSSKQKNYFNEERMGRILPATLVAVGFALLTCIVNPLEIFANNVAEFRSPLSSFVWWLVLYFFVLAIFIFSVIFFTPKKLSKVMYVTFLFLYVIMFLQVNFFNFDMHSLGGDGQQSGVNILYMVIDVLIWLMVLAGLICMTIFVKNHGLYRTICLVLTVAILAAQLVSVTTVCATTDGMFTNQSKNRDDKCFTTLNLTQLSNSNNVLFFVVDRFDTLEYALPALQKHPEIFQNLDGFTFYQDNVSRYSATYPALVNMLTNVDDFGMDRFDFFQQAYGENHTIAKLAEEGYLISLYTDTYYGYDPATPMPSYISNQSRVQFMRLHHPYECAMMMLLMGLYRSFPLPLKGIITVSSQIIDSFARFSVVDITDEVTYSTDMKFLHNYIQNRGFTFTDQPVFSLIHLAGCHEVLYNDQWKRVHSRDMTYSIKNSFSIIDDYLSALKAAGKYEDATIIIAGDHGMPANNAIKRREPSLTALFIKPAGVSSGEMQLSQKQTSHTNIWASIFQSENIDYSVEEFGKSVFDLGENETVKRQFISNMSFGNWKQWFYVVEGPASDWSSWSFEKVDEYDKNLFD